MYVLGYEGDILFRVLFEFIIYVFNFFLVQACITSTKPIFEIGII